MLDAELLQVINQIPGAIEKAFTAFIERHPGHANQKTHGNRFGGYSTTKESLRRLKEDKGARERYKESARKRGSSSKFSDQQKKLIDQGLRDAKAGGLSKETLANQSKQIEATLKDIQSGKISLSEKVTTQLRQQKEAVDYILNNAKFSGSTKTNTPQGGGPFKISKPVSKVDEFGGFASESLPAVKARKQAALNKRIRTREFGDQSRKEFAEMAHQKGWKVDRDTMTGRRGKKTTSWLIGDYEVDANTAEYLQHLYNRAKL